MAAVTVRRRISPRRTLVTGGNGFIGRYLVRALLAAGHQVLVADWRGSQPETGAELVLLDVRDHVAVTEAMAHCDSFIHLAGILGTSETLANPIPAATVNIFGGLHVLQAARQYKVPGVVIAVGNHFMNNTYAISKTTVERFCAMYRDEHGLDVSVVRALNAYGPGQAVAAPFGPSQVRKVMPSFICRALTGKAIEVYGDGSQIMDMIFVADVANILTLALERTITHGALAGVVEAGTGRHTSVADIATLVSSASGRSVGIRFLPMRAGEPEHAVVVADTDTLDLLGEPGWIKANPLVPLEVGVQTTLDWYENHWLPGWHQDQS